MLGYHAHPAFTHKSEPRLEAQIWKYRFCWFFFLIYLSEKWLYYFDIIVTLFGIVGEIVALFLWGTPPLALGASIHSIYLTVRANIFKGKGWSLLSPSAGKGYERERESVHGGTSSLGLFVFTRLHMQMGIKVIGYAWSHLSPLICLCDE